MSGYIGNDGSALAGGINPLGALQGLKVDSLGNLSVEDMIRLLTMNGQAFSATTGKLASPSAATLGFQLFNPANSGKNLLIFSLVVIYGAGSIDDFRMTTADVSSIAGWTNTAITPVNNKGGGPASVATCGCSNTNLTGGLLGTSRETNGEGANQPSEFLTNGECIFLPTSASINGIAVYKNTTGTQNWGITASYLEF